MRQRRDRCSSCTASAKPHHARSLPGPRVGPARSPRSTSRDTVGRRCREVAATQRSSCSATPTPHWRSSPTATQTDRSPSSAAGSVPTSPCNWPAPGRRRCTVPYWQTDQASRAARPRRHHRACSGSTPMGRRPTRMSWSVTLSAPRLVRVNISTRVAASSARRCSSRVCLSCHSTR